MKNKHKPATKSIAKRKQSKPKVGKPVKKTKTVLEKTQKMNAEDVVEEIWGVIAEVRQQYDYYEYEIVEAVQDYLWRVEYDYKFLKLNKK